MGPHFCKVGKIKPNLSKLSTLKEIETKITNFVEDVSKVEFEDSFDAASI